MRRQLRKRFLIFLIAAVTIGLLGPAPVVMAQKQVLEKAKAEQVPKDIEEKKVKKVGPIDEHNRGTPRGAIEGFLVAARGGDYEKAANYLDRRNLRGRAASEKGPDLARQLKIVLDRALWIDLREVSDDPKGRTEDGLPSYRESLARIETPEGAVDILLQRVPREDGVSIWKFSNRTVAKVPLLYEYHGYDPFEEALSNIFPDVVFLGWQLWQWAAFLIFLVGAYLVARILTWGLGRFVRRKGTERSRRIAQLITGPARILLWLLLGKVCMIYIGLSVTLRRIEQAGTLLTIAVVWFLIRLVDLIVDWMSGRLTQTGQETAPVLLQPVKTALKVVIIISAAMVWLDNLGFHVGTLLAGLGVGGLAVALAAQDTLKNLIGSITILLDKPYKVGQRIVAKGHDGVVEEIGLRSTRLRLLTGHQTTIPNDEMVRADIENIGRRPHIRRLTNIALRYDTPLEKVEKAVQIIEELLDDHEGMDSELPPRVYFNEFNRDSLNIFILYWYQPADYWAFMAFGQKLNVKIMAAFEKEGIKFALPSSSTFLAQDDKPLQMDILQHSGQPKPEAD